MKKFTHLFEAIETVALSESVEQYHFDQAHAHNACAKEAHDKSLNHGVAAESTSGEESKHHEALADMYASIVDAHAALAKLHGAKHDALKNSVRD